MKNVKTAKTLSSPVSMLNVDGPRHWSCTYLLDMVNSSEEQVGDVVGDVPEVDSLVRAWSCEGRQGY